jgi:hypothetical protein
MAEHGPGDRFFALCSSCFWQSELKEWHGLIGAGGRDVKRGRRAALGPSACPDLDTQFQVLFD